MDEGALLVGRIEKWAWALTAVFSVVGWIGGGFAFGAGVAAGGIVGILNFKWLHFFLRLAMAADRRWAKLLAHLGTAVRYLALTAAVLVLIKTRWVNLFAMLVGLSVVSVAVIGAGLLHGLEASKPANQPG